MKPVLLCCVLCFSVLSSREQETPQFRAAIVKVNITPSEPKHLLGYGARVSTGVHDSIYHRILMLDDGVTQFVLVSTDICLMSPTEYDHVAALIQKNSVLAETRYPSG